MSMIRDIAFPIFNIARMAGRAAMKAAPKSEDRTAGGLAKGAATGSAAVNSGSRGDAAGKFKYGMMDVMYNPSLIQASDLAGKAVQGVLPFIEAVVPGEEGQSEGN